MDIYIKPKKKADLSDTDAVTAKDVCSIYAPKNISDKIDKMKLLKIDKNEANIYTVSVLSIIAKIMKAYPDASVVNVGEMDTLINYKPKQTPDTRKNRVLNGAKIALVSLVLLAGSATAVMSFHSDAQMPQIFKTYHRIFFGKTVEKPLIIDIPYAFGLAVGIVVFFNHFGAKKLSKDPTPIEVEMAVYDGEVSDALIESENAKKEV
ncbi:stage V sporulation protein AA [Clostridia bacterium]|nr:stage V sporulation protein AA [Clostridia bacterium]